MIGRIGETEKLSNRRTTNCLCGRLEYSTKYLLVVIQTFPCLIIPVYYDIIASKTLFKVIYL